MLLLRKLTSVIPPGAATVRPLGSDTRKQPRIKYHLNMEALSSIHSEQHKCTQGQNPSEHIEYPTLLLRVPIRQQISQRKKYQANQKVRNPYQSYVSCGTASRYNYFLQFSDRPTDDNAETAYMATNQCFQSKQRYQRKRSHDVERPPAPSRTALALFL